MTEHAQNKINENEINETQDKVNEIKASSNNDSKPIDAKSVNLESIIDNNEAQNADGAESKEQILQKIIQELEAQNKELNDKMLRALAEAQNIKRRAEMESAKVRDFAIEKFAKEMMSVLDNLYRTVESMSDEDVKNYGKIAAIKEGAQITQKDMENAFQRNGIDRINPLNEKFDHNFHQALSQVPTENVEAGTIIEVIQSGYVLNGRLLRPALVILASQVKKDGNAS